MEREVSYAETLTIRTKQGTWIDGSRRIGLGSAAAAAPGNLSVMHNDQHHPRSPGALDVTPRSLSFYKLSGWFWCRCTPKFENHWWKQGLGAPTQKVDSWGQNWSEKPSQDLSETWEMGTRGEEEGPQQSGAGLYTLPNPWHGFPLGLHGFMQMKGASLHFNSGWSYPLDNPSLVLGPETYPV